MKTKSKVRRMWKVLSMAFVIFLQVYWYKFRKKPEADWEKLWDSIGKRFRKTLFELEGLLIKIGQLLSIRGDLLPHSFIRQIQDLTDKVPPSEWNDIQRILEKEWGGPTEEHFLSIEKKAVASASIGEVYKGTLKDGQEVAIKVQRPYIQKIIKTDFRTLQIIIWFADHFVPIPKNFINFKVLFKELKHVIERELDFSQEKNTLLAFQDRFKETEGVKIPSVHSELCTPIVIVMEWVEGIKFTDEDGVNSLEISRHELVKRLIKVFLPQWLEPGQFHADPHAGNVLVSKKGEIILLDFGMIGEISKKDATYFQGLIESTLAKNYSKAVECLTHLGFLLPEADPKTMERLLEEWMSVTPSQLKEVDMIALKMEMNDIIQALPIQVPTRFVFLGRSFVTLEGIILSLASEDEIVDIVKPEFMDWLDTHGNKKWSFIWHWLQSQPLFKFLYTVTEFFKLPQKMEEMQEKELRRTFQFTIYENYKKQLFQLTLLGFLGIGAGIYTSHELLLQVSTGVSAVSSIGYLLVNHKLKKWMRFMHEKRKH
ncbi:ABC1 kinase family protein [Evansella sp. AB-rgal1]|uniref:ABC1 kinase family protein n=1 Tax=Evansella sp. AB-rgal1 TaxID=3242696 RepID=UPI00359DCA4D